MRRFVFIYSIAASLFLIAGWTSWGSNWWAKYLYNGTEMSDNGEVYLKIETKDNQDAGIRLIRSGTGSTDWYMLNDNGVFSIKYGTNNTSFGSGLFFNSLHNLGIGTSLITGGSYNIVFKNGSNPTSPSAGYSRIYAKDVAGISELFVYDGAGNETQISPHDPQTGEWVFFSRNVKTGRVVKIHMEELIFDLAKEMSKKTGKRYIEEWHE